MNFTFNAREHHQFNHFVHCCWHCQRFGTLIGGASLITMPRGTMGLGMFLEGKRARKVDVVPRALRKEIRDFVFKEVAPV